MENESVQAAIKILENEEQPFLERGLIEEASTNPEIGLFYLKNPRFMQLAVDHLKKPYYGNAQDRLLDFFTNLAYHQVNSVALYDQLKELFVLLIKSENSNIYRLCRNLAVEDSLKILFFRNEVLMSLTYEYLGASFFYSNEKVQSIWYLCNVGNHEDNIYSSKWFKLFLEIYPDTDGLIRTQCRYEKARQILTELNALSVIEKFEETSFFSALSIILLIGKDELRAFRFKRLSHHFPKIIEILEFCIVEQNPTKIFQDALWNLEDPLQILSILTSSSDIRDIVRSDLVPLLPAAMQIGLQNDDLKSLSYCVQIISQLIRDRVGLEKLLNFSKLNPLLREIKLKSETKFWQGLREEINDLLRTLNDDEHVKHVIPETVDDVCQWLEKEELGVLIDLFQKERVNGKQLADFQRVSAKDIQELYEIQSKALVLRFKSALNKLFGFRQ